MIEVVVVIGWISSAIFSGIIANSKGRSGVGWAFAGLVFGPFGMLAAGLVEPMTVEHRELEMKRRREAEVKRMVRSGDDGGAGLVADTFIDEADDDAY